MEANQEKIVETETNQDFIMAQGGVTLLSIRPVTSSDAPDVQIFRMVAGAIANPFGNAGGYQAMRGT
ncbi:unnamed protein product [Urochloa humidicola]